MKYEEMQMLKRFEVHVNVADFITARSSQTTLLVTVNGEQNQLAMDHMSNLLMEKRVLHSVVMLHGRKTLISVDDMPNIWACAMASGVTVNIHREKGPMSSFILNELSCALVRLQLKVAGSITMGNQSIFTITKQLRPDEMQCVQFHQMQLVGDRVHLSFSPIVYSLKTADSYIRELKMNAAMTDETISNNVVTSSLLHAVPTLSECRILQYTTLPPAVHSTQPNSDASVSKYVPISEADYRIFWKTVYRITLPDDFGGYLRVQFASGEEAIYPSSCVASNFHTLHKQSRLEAQDIARMLLLSLKASFGKTNVAMIDFQRQGKIAEIMPASALLDCPISNTGSMHTIRKRIDSPRKCKRVKAYE